MFRPSIILLFFPVAVYTQKNISEIKTLGTKLMIENGFNASADLIKTVVKSFPNKEINFLFKYSTVRVPNKGGYRYYPFTGLDTLVLNSEKIDEIRYEYLYRDGKIEKHFTVMYNANAGTRFLMNSTVNDLAILDSLKMGYCNTCMEKINNYAAQNKIVNYYLSILTIKENDSMLAKRFLWSVITNAGKVYLVNPISGKEVNGSKYPKLSIIWPR